MGEMTIKYQSSKNGKDNEMIEFGEQVFFGEYTDENGARRMLIEQAKKLFPEIDESRIKLIIKKNWWGYITGAWHVQVKEAEYIRMLERENRELKAEREYLLEVKDGGKEDDCIHCGKNDRAAGQGKKIF